MSSFDLMRQIRAAGSDIGRLATDAVQRAMEEHESTQRDLREALALLRNGFPPLDGDREWMKRKAALLARYETQENQS